MMRQALVDIFSLIKRNKLLFAISSLLDLSFIIAFMAAFWQIVYENIFTILLQISDIMKGLESISSDFEAQAQAYSALASSIEFLGLYANLIRWLLILIIVVFLLWLVFGGLSFFVTSKMIDKKTKFWRYIGKFSLFSLFFYVLVVLSFWLTIFLSMLNAKIVVPVFTQGVVNVFLIILLVVIHYFCLLSLVMVRKRKIVAAFLDTFKIGVKRITKVLMVYIIVGVILLIFILLNYLFFSINISLSYFGILLLLIPSISFSRIMIFYMIEKVK